MIILVKNDVIPSIVAPSRVNLTFGLPRGRFYANILPETLNLRYSVNIMTHSAFSVIKKMWAEPGPRNIALQHVQSCKEDQTSRIGALSTTDGVRSSAKLPKVPSDDLDREVFGILGIPVDAVDMATVLQKIAVAVAQKCPLLLSTANLNFVVTSLSSSVFRDSLLLSDVCTADGMSIVWISRILGVPIGARITGADIIDELKAIHRSPPVTIFLFGGEPGVAAKARKRMNAEADGLECVGVYEPGFGMVEDMSTDPVIDTVNASNADVLGVALGAEKGQAWLRRNHTRLTIPIRTHIGATFNFQAGTIQRAPRRMQRLGLEWLWRIGQEPHLWRRYWHDGRVLARLMVTRIVPLVVLTRWRALRSGNHKDGLSIEREEVAGAIVFRLKGAACGEQIDLAIASFRSALKTSKNVVINFADTTWIDPRFLGLILMLNKELRGRGLRLSFADASPRITRCLRLNGFEFMFSELKKA